MPPPRRHIPLLIASHLLAIALGYAAWRAADPSRTHGSSNSPAPMKANRDRNADRRLRDDTAEGKAERERRGEALLSRALEMDVRLPGSLMKYHEDPLPPEELIRMADATPPAEDLREGVEQAIRELLRKDGEGASSLQDARELQVRYLHWLRADPAAALDFVASDPAGWGRGDLFGSVTDVAPDGALRALARERGWRALLGYAKEERGEILRGAIIGDFARQGDDSAFAALEVGIGALPGSAWDLGSPLLRSWPFAKADGFLRLVQAGIRKGEAGEEDESLSQQASVLIDFARSHGGEGSRWLLQAMDSPAMDGKLAGELQGLAAYKDLLAEAGGMSLEKRLERRLEIQTADPFASLEESTAEKAADRLISQDVAKALGDGRDWAYAFRAGAVTAEEVLAAMREKLPEMDAAMPGKLREQLFKELIHQDAPAAMALVADLPEAERWRLALAEPDRYPGPDDPRKLAAWLGTMPEDVAAELWDRRLEMWGERGRLMPVVAGGFPEWVAGGMPDGVDRGMAAYHILVWTAEWTPLAGRLRALVTDPRLLERLEKQKGGAE